MRRKTLSHLRLVERMNYLNKCQSEVLTPADIVYRLNPPQGFDMTPAEITSWKACIVQCEQSILAIAIQTCTRELTYRERLMSEAKIAMTTCISDTASLQDKAEQQLSKNIRTHRAIQLSKYTEMYDSAKLRKRAFQNNTNPARFGRIPKSNFNREGSCNPEVAVDPGAGGKITINSLANIGGKPIPSLPTIFNNK